MGLTDAFMAFPRIFLVLLLVSLAAPSLALVMVVLGLTGWMGVARLVRAETLSLQRAGLRGGGPRLRPGALAGGRAPRVAPPGAHGDRGGLPAHRRGHPGRGLPQLPGPGGPGACHQLGRHDPAGPGRPGGGLVADGVPRAWPSRSRCWATTCWGTACGPASIPAARGRRRWLSCCAWSSGRCVSAGRTGPPLLADVDLVVAPGESVALVGPSGSGKTLTALSICGLLPPGGLHRRPRALAGTRARRRATDPGWRGVRGAGRDPGAAGTGRAALNPVLRVGDQVAETVRRHAGGRRAAARARALELLAEVRLPDPVAAAHAWPHQLSGGMQQRALLAAALACDAAAAGGGRAHHRPGSDGAGGRARRCWTNCDDSRDMALLFITHDRHLVPLLADRRVELAAGRVVASARRGRSSRTMPRGAARAGRAARGRGTGAGGPRAAPALCAGGRAGGGRRRPGRGGGRGGGPGGGVGQRQDQPGAPAQRAPASRRGHGAPGRRRPRPPPRVRNVARLRRRVQLLFQHAGGSLDPRQTVAACLAEAAGRPRWTRRRCWRRWTCDPALARAAAAPPVGRAAPARRPGALPGRVRLGR